MRDELNKKRVVSLHRGQFPILCPFYLTMSQPMYHAFSSYSRAVDLKLTRKCKALMEMIRSRRFLGHQLHYRCDNQRRPFDDLICINSSRAEDDLISTVGYQKSVLKQFPPHFSG
jgi:hypothetical protein